MQKDTFRFQLLLTRTLPGMHVVPCNTAECERYY